MSCSRGLVACCTWHDPAPLVRTNPIAIAKLTSHISGLCWRLVDQRWSLFAACGCGPPCNAMQPARCIGNGRTRSMSLKVNEAITCVASRQRKKGVTRIRVASRLTTTQQHWIKKNIFYEVLRHLMLSYQRVPRWREWIIFHVIALCKPIRGYWGREQELGHVSSCVSLIVLGLVWVIRSFAFRCHPNRIPRGHPEQSGSIRIQQKRRWV